MSELIDAVCDICGRQYRWPDERLGESATCRYCGTKFEVQVFVAPEEDTNANDLRWFKGVGVAILVLTVVVGLSSLLMIRPSATGWTVTGGSWRFPRFRATAGGRSAEAERHFALAEERDNQFLGEMRRNAGMTGSIPIVRTYPRTRKRTPSPFTIISPTVNSGHLATSAPVVTEWGFVGESSDRKLQLKGTGLQGLTKFQHRFGSGLSDAKCHQVSDTLLETDGFFVKSSEVTLYVIANPHGMAVVFSDNIATVDTNQTLARRQPGTEPDLFLIRNGGHLVSERPTGVLVDQGGRAAVRPWVIMAIVKRGGELKTQMPSSTILEAGASVTAERPGINDLSKPVTVPKITFFRLPVIDKK
ncbi:MAG: hypothetical protein JWN70_6499 [Planctomycetaceae bacterium]|nr:hypothetical protein [Planctomycetaceae bacterium]